MTASSLISALDSLTEFDGLRLRVIADAFDDAGEHEQAEAWRWLADNNKWIPFPGVAWSWHHQTFGMPPHFAKVASDCPHDLSVNVNQYNRMSKAYLRAAWYYCECKRRGIDPMTGEKTERTVKGGRQLA